MIDINELKEAIQTFGSQAINEDNLNELLDRLEAAEKAITEAYQRGYATGQEEIAAEFEFAKREIANLHDDISEWMDKCDALRAKIERMEKQEPVAEIGRQYVLLFVGSGSITGIVERHGIKVGDKLYALPGAKGEEKWI